MRPADEGQQVVLADGIQGDVLDQHQLVVAGALVEDFQKVFGVCLQPGEDFLVHAGHPGGGFQQALPAGVLAHGLQDFPDGALQALCIHSVLLSKQ